MRTAPRIARGWSGRGPVAWRRGAVPQPPPLPPTLPVAGLLTLRGSLESTDWLNTSAEIPLVLGVDIAGRHVLIVEDILATGHTLHKIYDLLSTRTPASLQTAVMLQKVVVVV